MGAQSSLVVTFSDIRGSLTVQSDSSCTARRCRLVYLFENPKETQHDVSFSDPHSSLQFSSNSAHRSLPSWHLARILSKPNILTAVPSTSLPAGSFIVLSSSSLMTFLFPNISPPITRCVLKTESLQVRAIREEARPQAD